MTTRPSGDSGAVPGGAGSRARGLAGTVVHCLVGAGLVLLAATRVWAVAVTPRPGLPDLRETSTGASEQGWIVALALVGLAGAGALLATRGVARRVLGLLLILDGVGLAAASIAARAGLDPGAAGAGAFAWPALCVIGAVIIALGGLSAARRGHQWAGMGSRYDRTAAPAPAEPAADTRAAWDALDRGDDPTA